MSSNLPFVPKRSDGVLYVLVIGRVSTIHQDESNIDAGYEYAEKHLKTLYAGPIQIKHLGERGSGMLVERTTILEASEEINSGRWDVVLVEDLSKCVRNPRWQLTFVQDALDAGVRVLALGDGYDSAQESAEIMLGAATLRHGLHIPDTRRRVRRTADYAFQRGGMVLRVKYGYRKLSKDEADSGAYGTKGLRMARVPEATLILQEMRTRILRGDSSEAVARWLRDEGVPTGPCVTTGVWTASYFGRYSWIQFSVAGVASEL